jgi:hypothetical protein
VSVTLTQGQELFVPPPAKKITSFTFRQFSGGVVLIKALFDDHKDSLNFILDTGSGGISLDSTTCAELGIETVPSDKTIKGIAGVRNVRFANNHSLHFPGLRVDSLDFHINDYAILTSVYGDRIDGIIGYSFISRYVVRLDYDSNRIDVFSKGSLKYPKGGHVLRPLMLNIPVQTGIVKEHQAYTARFYFDIGAGLCLLLSSDFVQDSSLFSSKKKMLATQAEGLGGKAAMLITTLKEFRLGPYKFRRVPTYIFDDNYNVTSYPFLGGLIGNDLMRRFNVTLNYDRREIFIIPNKHFREPFDYAYTGLGIYYIEGEVVISDVMPDSPAEQAGLKPGDVVVSMNNNLSRNIQVYKNMLQIAGEKIKMLVVRNGEPVQVTLKVKSILRGR